MLAEVLLGIRAEDGNRGGGGDRKSLRACTEVSMYCPVEATVLGYKPNLGSSIFFAIAFGLLLIGALTLGIWKRTWTFCVAISLGLALETAGYVGRGLLHKNPWDSGAFQLQICAIILGPTFICVSIYLTLKHVALTLNPTLSRLPPIWYPRIFLPADLSCLILQAIGGGVAAAAGRASKTDRKLLDTGNNVIIAGIVLQVVVLLTFGILGFDYFLRVRKYMRSPQADTGALSVWRDAKFRRFGFAVVGAFVAILIRCIYRIAEMAGGWGNHIMQDEISFLILDPTLVLVATFLLTVFHPGLFFPQMRNGSHAQGYKAGAQPDSTGESGNEERKG